MLILLACIGEYLVNSMNLLLTNLSDVDMRIVQMKSQYKIDKVYYFKIWGFSRLYIKSCLDDISDELKEADVINLALKPQFFGNRVKYLSNLVRTTFTEKTIIDIEMD